LAEKGLVKPTLYDAMSSIDFWLIVLIFLPVVLSFFMASRLRMGDLMRDRPRRASMRKLAMTFGGALTLSVAILAVVRLTTVPTASLGYQLDPWVLRQNVDYQANHRKFQEIRNSLESNNHFADYKAAWKKLHTMLESPLQSPGVIYSYDSVVYSMISQQVMQDDVTPEFLRDAIAFLEKAPEDRVPAVVGAQRFYEREFAHIKDGKTMYYNSDDTSLYERMRKWCRVIAPWEKLRARKFAEYRFQTDSLIAEQSERLIYYNEGDAQYLAMKIDALNNENSNRFLYGDSCCGLPVIPVFLYMQEQSRRVAILQAALRLWYMEHGELPATLDEPAGVYLTEVPLVPYFNRPFEYNPHPGEGNDADAGIVLRDGSRLVGTHVKGTPYIAVTFDGDIAGHLQGDFAVMGNNKEYVFDLPFAK
jgi:hypothetical protein